MNSQLNTKLRVIPLLISLALSGCLATGGGGSGSFKPGSDSITNNNNSGTNTQGLVTSFTLADSLKPLNANVFTYVTHDLFAQDLNKDNVDEVIYAGRPSNYPGATFAEVDVNIFGWNTNKTRLTNETSTWFASGANKIKGTEPTVLFGNFTGTGNTDIFMAQSSDRADPNSMGPAIIYKNNGNNTLTRIELSGTTSWSHGAAIFDINGDGLQDVMAVSYNNNSFTILGGSTPQVYSQVNNNGTGTDAQGRAVAGIFGSGITLGKFMGDGKVYAVVADGPDVAGVAGSNGRISIMEVYVGDNYVNGVNTNTKIAGVVPSTAKMLPVPYLEAQEAARLGLSEAQYIQRGDSNLSHDIRVVTLQLNNDNLPDLAVISRPNAIDNNWAAVAANSYVTFYKNLGNGNFARTGIFTKENASYYNVSLKDINGDGRQDLILSSQHGNTSILLAKTHSNGDIVYVEAGSSVIQDFENKMKDQPGDACIQGSNCIGAVNIVQGPNGKNFLVGVRNQYAEDGQRQHIYYSAVESSGTLTIDAAIQTLMSQWNITQAQAQEILTLTGTKWAEGTIINMAAAMRPVGGFYFPINGKLTPYQGGISGIQNNTYVNNIAGFDAYNREFNVNFTKSIDQNFSDFWSKRNYQAINHGFASFQLQNTEIIDVANFKFNRTNSTIEGLSNWAFGVNGIVIDKNTQMAVGMSRINFNPWLSMSGSWGQINNSSILEASVIHNQGPWNYRAGLMQVTSEFRPGLVTDVRPIYAGWADLEYEFTNKFKLAGGILPYAFLGGVDMTLPTNIDKLGNITYTNTSSSVKDTVRSYLRMDYSGTVDNYKNISYNVNGLITNNGVPAIRAYINYNFK